MLNVTLLSHGDGENIIALAAKLCYSDADIESLREKVSSSDQSGFIEKVTTMGHFSVLEHLSFTFGIEGVSRALTHQLVRHRVASFSQKSQRYVKHDRGFDYITPASIGDNKAAKASYDKIMADIATSYDKFISLGIPAEDARFLLPNACETKIIVTMNARELLHFFKVRCCLRAQWEIREMAIEMLKLVIPVAPAIFSVSGPSCVSGACSEGKFNCGQAVAVRAKFKDIVSCLKKASKANPSIDQ